MITNAKSLPKVYYGMHMEPGVAEYREPGAEPYRIMIGEETIKNMDSTFAGKPVYVRHVDQVNLENLQNEADGYVSESFYNKADGKHWAKFIVVSDKGHEAISLGWKLSNAYIPQQLSGGGLWHGVEFTKEVVKAEYEHLAIVPNPRYEESVIMTPDQFKEYNSKKELELTKLSNSTKRGDSSMFNIFKRQKVENSADYENMVVVLPKSKIEKTLVQLVNEADASEQKMNEDEKNLNAMKSEMEDLKKENASLKSELEELKKKNTSEGEEKKENEEEDETKKNKEDEDQKNQVEEEKKNEEDKEKKNQEEEKEMKNKKNSHFEELKNAPSSAIKNSPRLDLSDDKVARGKARYGSN